MTNTSEERVTVPATASNIVYRPVYKHWFYNKIVSGKSIWQPFSFNDSMLLEEVYTSKGIKR